MATKRKRQSPLQKFFALDDAEKDAAVEEFDTPSETDYGFAPLGAKSKRIWKKAKRRRGRPKIGAGAAKVLVSVERRLLHEADALAKREGISRSQLFARGLAALLEHRRRAG